MAQINFNAANVAPQESIAPIPSGVYLAHVTESDVRALKNGNGTALALTFQVLQGPYANRKVWSSINVKHTNAEAERIAQSQLSALCHAVGVINLQDTTQLHMRPVNIRVKIRKDETGQYGDRNEVSGYEAATGAAVPTGVSGGMFPPAPPAAQQPQQANPFGAPPAAAPAAAPAPAAAAAPWARRTANA